MSFESRSPLAVPSQRGRQRRWLFCALASSGFLVALDASAQAYPNRPIRIVIGFAAGGQADALARLVALKLTSQLNQSVIVENKPGAGGNIGTDFVARAPADGYTLLLTAPNFVVNTSLYKRVNYDPIKDFSAITSVMTYPLYLVGNTAAPKTVQGVIASAKAKSEGMKYSTSGQGTSTHLAAELFATAASVKFMHVPYKGGAQSALSTAAGETDIHFSGVSVIPLVKSGKLNLIAVTGPDRQPGFPDVPTVAETLPGYQFLGWNALFAPAGTPPEIIRTLNRAVAEGINQPDALEVLKNMDSKPAAGTPEELGALVKSELVKWTKVVKDLGLSVD